ncbi:serine hydrolase domain-containing protein [Actinomadura sp. HBU206391]|uniref:serine hydrolase domain-containing protein n=1 Tax=Actinomadura sp. HBU206391 TaxID=2731692 RepID=UPI0016502C72|nr:serine hydrolase domain-containing protein [Actinomadura sp. HBU206391]MBC6463321.1 beta-lactamase family protein [Actinomadura sp. HBU206391]
MAQTHGRCDDRFGEVRRALAASLDDDDVGASAAVYLDGVPVVDIWGGYTDEARTLPWERDTITNVWSTTKTMTALCALILADRGDLDLDAPVPEYWPEFAVAGKDRVRVRHLLSHTAGLPTWDEPMAVEDLYDWPTATARLAAQAPHWEPGAEAGYHAFTQGYLVGEVVRRVTGRSLGAFFGEEVAGPLGADFHIGLPAEHDHRVAPIIAPPPVQPAQTGGADTGKRTGTGTTSPRSAPGNPPIRPIEANTPAWRRAEIPAANGHGNARSVGAVQSVLACGGAARGVRLLSQAGCERALEEQFRGVDRILGVPMRYGMGYGMSGGQLPNPRTCFWGGWGGSLVLIDLDARMTVSYVMNRMLDDQSTLGDDRGLGIVLAAYEGLSA